MPSPSVIVVGTTSMDINFDADCFPFRGKELVGYIRLLPGGKGFFEAVACRRLDATSTFISSVGDDDLGKRIIRELREIERVNCRIQEVPEINSTDAAGINTDLTAVFQGKGDEKTAYISRRNVERLDLDYLENTLNDVSSAGTVLLSFDLGQARVQKTIEIAQKFKRPIFLNASPPANVPLTIVRGLTPANTADRVGVDFVVVTREEAKVWLISTNPSPPYKREVDKMSEEQVADHILAAGAKHVIMTVDDDRCLVADDHTYRWYTCEKPAIIISHNGARSAFCAALAVRYTEQQLRAPGQAVDITDLVRFAAATRYYIYDRGGTYRSLPYRLDVETFLKNRPGAELQREQPRDLVPDERL